MSALQKYKDQAKEAEVKIKNLESQLNTLQTAKARSDEERAWFLILLCAPPFSMGLLDSELRKRAPDLIPTPEKVEEAQAFLTLKYPTLHFGPQ